MVTTEKKMKALPNNWSFVSDRIQGEEEDEHGNFTKETMLCFVKHGTLVLTFHANFDSGIVCSKCFQFMKPGSCALHCKKCKKQAVLSKKEIKKWADSAPSLFFSSPPTQRFADRQTRTTCAKVCGLDDKTHRLGD